MLPTKSQTKVLFVYGMRRVLMLKRYSVWRFTQQDTVAGWPAAGGKILRFYGSSMKISLDFDAIWHLEHSF